MKARLARLLPPNVRELLREAIRELPFRLRDAAPDLIDRLATSPNAPPPRLRRRVSNSSSRREFLSIGGEAARDVATIFEAVRVRTREYPRWLDFGCGPGRVSRHLTQLGEVRELWGVDVDADAIAWCRASLPGQYKVIGPAPPMPLATGFFDVVLASSVFTHLDEARQLGWIAELHRVLCPGGLLIASTHAPSLSAFRPDLSAKDRDELAHRGFLFAPGGNTFSSDSTFHSRDYLVTTWGRLFGLEHYRQYGLNRYQDLSAWRKW